MSLETTIRTILAAPQYVVATTGGQPRADALLAIATLLGGRVVPIMAAKPCRPFIAYTINDAEDPAPTHDGPSGFTRGEFDLILVTDTYLQGITISDLVRVILDGFAGTVGIASGTDVKWVRRRDQSDIEQAPEPGGTTPAYVRQMTFAALIKEAAQ